MALAVDVINRRGPRNKMRRQLQPKEDLSSAILTVYVAAEDILSALHY